MKAAAVITLAAACVDAHNWLKAPVSRNKNKAARAKPCPPAANDYTPMKAEVGEEIEFVWSTNHNGNHWMKMVEKGKENELEAGNKIEDVDNKVKSVKIKAPTTPGDYVYQYGWSGYRNCVDVKVEAAAPPPTAAPAPTASGEPGKDSGVNLNCATYCADIMETCTGSMAQYTDESHCLSSCSTFPRGNPGDKTGNTLDCRWYHLHAEVTGSSNTVHCNHAGGAGGGPGYCVGTEILNPGVSFSITVTDPKDVTGPALAQKVKAALQAGGYTGCVNVMDPVLTNEKTYNVIVTFCKNADGSHASDPADDAAALATGAGNQQVLDALIAADPSIQSAIVDTYIPPSLSESDASVAKPSILIAAAATAYAIL